jgi:hypothetical protein
VKTGEAAREACIFAGKPASRNLAVQGAALLLIFLTITIFPRPAFAQASTCKASQLSVSEDRKESDGIDGGVGHHAITIAIQNRSSSACVLYGVPTLNLSESGNRPFSVQVCSNCESYLFGKQPIAEISLEPKRSAYVVLGYNINDRNGQLQCSEPHAALTLKLYLSNQREPLSTRIVVPRICGGVDITPFLAKPPEHGSLPR